MHDVNQLLEQNEVAWSAPDTSTYQDAVELPPLEFGGDHCLRSLTKVGQTIVRVIAKSLHPFDGGVESRHHLCGVHARKGGEVRR